MTKFFLVVLAFVLCFAFVLADESTSASAEAPTTGAAPVAPSPPAVSSVASRLSHRVTPPVVAASSDPSSEASAASEELDVLAQQADVAMSQYLIDVVNALPDRTWTAGFNDYFQNKSFSFLKQSCGLKMDLDFGSAQNLQPVQIYPNPPSTYPVINTASGLPASFDARLTWGGQCPSLYDIRDQAGCGSCWAVAAAEVMTDRHCIHSGGRNRPYLSATNILSCCGSQCGSCEGGMPLPAFQFWQSTGVVTGGGYGTSDSCQPYYLAPCAHHVKNSFLPECVAQTATPTCSQSCTHGSEYSTDKHYGASAYAVTNTVEAIQRELMTNGPIEVGFMVYADFPLYQSGVYSHVAGKMVGGHAVKLMGWGNENGRDYWLCANSWNTNWGDNGFFKISRGTNEGNIENMAWAGIPRTA